MWSTIFSYFYKHHQAETPIPCQTPLSINNCCKASFRWQFYFKIYPDLFWYCFNCSLYYSSFHLGKYDKQLVIKAIKICHPSKNFITHTHKWRKPTDKRSYEHQQRKEIQATVTTTRATNTQLRTTGKIQRIPKGIRNHTIE